MEITNEATYNFGKEEYTKKNLTPTEILDLAYAYAQTSVNKIVGNKLDHRIKSANDLSRLIGSTQMDTKVKSGKPALILHLLKNSLVTKDEYVELYKELVGKHISVVKALKNASPERRRGGSAAKAAARDMKGEFGESVNEEKVYIDFLNKKKGFKQDRIKFTSYEAAVKWAKKNFDNFNPDMIKYESVNEEQINELSADTYKNTVKAALQRGDSKGNSIAVKALQSFGKEIAKELAGKSFEVKGSMKDVTKALYKGSSYSYINQVKMTFTGEGSLFHDNNVKVFGSDEAHFNMNVQFQLPDNIGGFSSDVKFRGYQNNKFPTTVQFSIKGGKVWVWFKGADTDLEFTRAGAREMAKLADTIVTAMDFPTKAKHNTIKQFDAMKPTTESVNENFAKFDTLKMAVNQHEKGAPYYDKIRLINIFNQLSSSDQVKAKKQYRGYFGESVNESTPDQVIKDLDKAKNDLLKKVDALIAKKKKLYSDVDIEAPMSADEKKLDKDIADLFSQINKLVLQKRSVKKESVNEGSLYSSQQLIKKLTPKIEKDVEVLKKQFPKYDISLVRNRYESDGSYTLSISGKNTSDTDNKTIQKVVASKIKESVNEAYVPTNIKEFAKRKGVTQLVNTVAGWAERVGKKISGGTAIGKNYNTLVLDMTYNGSEIYINCETERVELYDELVRNFQQFKKVYDEYQMDESVNEGSMSDIDILAQEAPNFNEFVKSFFADYKDFPKTKDSLKWLEDIYKGRTKMEGLGADGLERVAQGLPQTEEEPEN
jgi:hypothetical protein